MKIQHHLYLLFGVAGACRYRHCAELFRACLKSAARSPKAVCHGDLHAILRRDARGLVAARKHRTPILHVFRGIRDYDRLSCRTRGRVDAHDFAVRDGLYPKRVGVSQRGFIRKRETLEVLLTADAGDAGFSVDICIVAAGGDYALYLRIDLPELSIVKFHLSVLFLYYCRTRRRSEQQGGCECEVEQQGHGVYYCCYKRA